MNNLRGILLVIAAMAAFSVEDTFIKYLTAVLPRGQVLFVLGCGGSLVFAILAWVNGNRIFTRANLRPIVIWRSLCEGLGAAAFITSLSLVHLSTVAAVFQVLPLAITFGAAVFLKEQVGWRRWSAIGVGFAGVMMIIRPGFDGFQPATIFVLLSVLAIAARDLITRRMPEDVSSTAVSFFGFFALVVTGPILLLFTRPPVMIPSDLAVMLLGAVAFGVMGYYAIVAAMRLGDASAIMPFRYTRLIFSMAMGIIIFGERPDALTYAGAALIIFSGLYTFLREHRAAQKLAPS